MPEYLLGFDQGSSSSKAVLADPCGNIIRTAAVPLKSFQPAAGGVEHDPASILRSQLEAARQVLGSIHKTRAVIAGLGIANQRSTLLLWDKGSGRPLCPAISWQDLRAAELIPQWEDYREEIRSKTGLMLTPYYAAPKIRWLLDHVKGLRTKAERGKCLFGTVNTWLIWHLTRGEVHATDHTNAARTLLMNLFTLSWDEDLLALFDIPSVMLPKIYPTTADFGQAHISGRKIPVRASIGDQQAGLIGIGAVNPGESVVNYGTGGFFLVNTGSRPIFISGLITSLAWTMFNSKSYVAEGTVNSVGTLFEWLKESGWIKSVSEIDRLAGASLAPLYLVPSLSGLGAPHWLSQARTTIFGIGAKTGRADIVRGAVEGIAFLIKDIVETVRKEKRLRIKSLTASGGGSKIQSLVQAQADQLGLSIRRDETAEATAAGAAFMAGVGCGWWKSPAEIPKNSSGKVFQPRLTRMERDRRYKEWLKAIQAVRTFYE